MPTSWLEFLFVAGLLALLGLAGNIIAGLINQKIPSPGIRTVALCTVGFIIASVAFAAYQANRSPSTGSDSTDTAENSPSREPVNPTSAGPAGSAIPTPTRSAAPSQTSSSPTIKPSQKRTEYLVSVNSSTTNTMPQHPRTPTFRYWYYQSASDVIGEIRYESSGGATGRWGWVPVAIGKDCAVPYVIFTMAGLPRGTYDVSVHIPDAPNLASQVEYGEIVLDQATHRGSWVSLGRQEVTDDSREIGIMQSQPYDSFGGSSGCRRSEQRVAYDAVRARRV